MKPEAYLVELKYGDVQIVAFTYEKKAAQLYMGCGKIRNIVGGYCYVPSRIPRTSAWDSIPDAVQHADVLMRGEIERRKIALNDARSRHGELLREARLLGVEVSA